MIDKATAFLRLVVIIIANGNASPNTRTGFLEKIPSTQRLRLLRFLSFSNFKVFPPYDAMYGFII